ncbi:MAG: two-component regulator propeller domain-containing protein [Ferruginibacter sp.]
MRSSRNMSHKLYFIINIVCIISCNTKRNVPFPQNARGEITPVSKQFQLSAEQPLNWETISPDSITPPETVAFNINTLPVKPFVVNTFKPLNDSFQTVKLNWDNIPDSAFALDPKNGTPFTLQKSILPKPEIIPASAPAQMPGTTAGFLQFSMSQGLPGDNTFRSIVDKNGNLWLATDKGVCMYDGGYLYNYTFFINPNINAATASLPIGLKEDHEGRIWVMTGGGGIYIMDLKNNMLSHYTSSLFFVNVMCDHDGNMWVSTYTTGIYYINKELTTIQKVNFTEDPGLTGQGFVVMEDRDNNIWLGSTKFLFILDAQRKKIKKIGSAEGLMANNIFTLYEDGSQNVWVGGTPGTATTSVSLKNKTISTRFGQDPLINFPIEFREDKRGQIWMVRNGSILILNKQKNASKIITTNAMALTGGIIGFSEDVHGNFWIGSKDKGEMIIDPNGPLPENIDSKDGLADNNVWGQMADKNGNMWLATFKGLNIYERAKNQIRFLGAKQGLKDTTLKNVVQLDEDNIMAPAIRGFALINLKNNTLSNYGKAQGFKADAIWNGIKDNTGNIWAGSSSGIYMLNQQNNSLKKLDKKRGLLSDQVWTFVKDKKGNLWTATDSGAMVINPTTNMVRYLRQKEGLCSNNVNKITIADNGNVWIGTMKGISIVNPDKNTITNVTTTEGLVPDEIYDLIGLGNKMYAASANGIIEITLPSGDIGALKNWSFINYDKGSGFPYNNYNQMAGTATSNGEIWWGVTPMVTLFTQPPSSDTLAGEISITAIKILDKDLNTEDYSGIKNLLKPNDTIWNEAGTRFYQKNTLPENTGYLAANKIKYDSLSSFYNLPVGLNLKYNQNSINFLFNNNNPIRRDKTVYRYILEGADTAWSDLTQKTMTPNYYNLSPGNYTFKVSTKDLSGIWSTPAEFNFTILPPWWKTWWAYLLFAIVFLSIAWLIAQYRSRWLKKENRILEEKVSHRTAQLNKSIQDLNSTQSQLIHSEKMASLGELTAGIAHEIQNPLNFVNNFSEVNKEMIDEMQAELKAGNTESAIAISNDIRDNEEKINHHGKRADAIVKVMLQHSQKSTGIKQPTNINALADEYLRLSYHGLRAKDKSFNAELKTDFDESIGKVNIVPQDIGRVLLNLFNNSFYATNEKKKTADENYKPFLSIQTRKINGFAENGSGQDRIEITVSDNGNGIPQNIIDKIFQPFFTTKPTGQGTGLGLSLSYDIIKAHGGEMRVDSQEKEGSTFIIQLPTT